MGGKRKWQRKKNKEPITMSQRVNDWRKKTSVAYTIKFNKATQSDIIKKLESVDNKTGYIASLIKADLEKNNA